MPVCWRTWSTRLKNIDNEGRKGIAEVLFFCLKKDEIQCISQSLVLFVKSMGIFYRNLRRQIICWKTHWVGTSDDDDYHIWALFWASFPYCLRVHTILSPSILPYAVTSLDALLQFLQLVLIAIQRGIIHLPSIRHTREILFPSFPYLNAPSHTSDKTVVPFSSPAV